MKGNDDHHVEARLEMLERQLASRGITDTRVLDAMRDVPRHAFVPTSLAELAYDDTPLPISAGQTISQPFIVARMAEAAALTPGDRVLDVGTGCGYAAAIAARTVGDRGHVDSIERHPELVESARTTLAALGISNVDVHQGDGTRGFHERAPFNATVAAAAGPTVPQPWREQLAIGGRLVMPLGSNRELQRLVRITRTSADDYQQEDLGLVSFVPLVGEFGWPADGGSEAHASVAPQRAGEPEPES